MIFRIRRGSLTAPLSHAGGERYKETDSTFELSAPALARHTSLYPDFPRKKSAPSSAAWSRVARMSFTVRVSEDYSSPSEVERRS